MNRCEGEDLMGCSLVDGIFLKKQKNLKCV